LPRESDILLRHFPMSIGSVSTPPKLVLSAHIHVGEVREEKMTRTSLRKVSGKFGHKYIEIVMPTCSYRMGVYQMAYGALILGNNDDFHFVPLHIPGRFQFLILYTFICLCWLFFFCI